MHRQMHRPIIQILLYSKILQTKLPYKSYISQCKQFFAATDKIEYFFIEYTLSI